MGGSLKYQYVQFEPSSVFSFECGLVVLQRIYSLQVVNPVNIKFFVLMFCGLEKNDRQHCII